MSKKLYQRWVQLHPNMSIKCSVTSCAHHCQDMDNCGLSSIQVGTHEAQSPLHGPVHRLPELRKI